MKLASQWETTMRMLLDDLAALPRERIRIARYDDLVADPQREIARLCTSIGIGWALPLAKHTVSQSRPVPRRPSGHARAENA